MNLFSDPYSELGAFGPYWTVIGLLAVTVVVLFKKLIDSKNDQISAAHEEHERNRLTTETIERLTCLLLSVLGSKNDKT